jgi:hypothetical protein
LFYYPYYFDVDKQVNNLDKLLLILCSSVAA